MAISPQAPLERQQLVVGFQASLYAVYYLDGWSSLGSLGYALANSALILIHSLHQLVVILLVLFLLHFLEWMIDASEDVLVAHACRGISTRLAVLCTSVLSLYLH